MDAGEELAGLREDLNLYGIQDWLRSRNAVLTIGYFGGEYIAELLGRDDPKLVPQGITYLHGKRDADLVTAVIGAMEDWDWERLKRT